VGKKGWINGDPKHPNLPQHFLCYASYVNEPPLDEKPNAIFIHEFNSELCRPIVILYIIRKIKTGREIYAYYGPEFERNYKISSYCTQDVWLERKLERLRKKYGYTDQTEQNQQLKNTDCLSRSEDLLY